MFACQRWLRPQSVNFLRSFSETLRRLAVYPGIRTISLSAARSHGASMRAWVLNRYGPNDVLAFTENHPAPIINFAHEVVVQVHAASLNPLDINMRGGYGAGVLRLRRDPRTMLQRGSEFPLVLGRDMSGVIVECGSGVTHVQVGDEVWASVPPWQQGSFAEYVILNGSDVSLKPKPLSHVEAASIPYVAATAWSALVTTGGLNSENCSKKRILVHGASGGVGTFSIQLLKAWGGHVTATCFQDGVSLVKELGADDVIDCSAADTASQLRACQKFDLILDNVGGDTESWAMDLLQPWSGSKFVTLVSPLLQNTDSLGLVDGVLQSGMTLHDKAIRSVVKGVFYRWAFYVPDGVALDRIGEMVTSGKIRPVVEATFPFSQVPEAFRKVEAGQALGKTVITIATEEAEPSSSHTDVHTPATATHNTHAWPTHAVEHMTAHQTHTISAMMSEHNPSQESVEGQAVTAGLVDQGQLETSPASGEELQEAQEVVHGLAQEVAQEMTQKVVHGLAQEVAQEMAQEVVQEMAQEVVQEVVPSTGAQPAEEAQATLTQPTEPAAAQTMGVNQHTESVSTQATDNPLATHRE